MIQEHEASYANQSLSRVFTSALTIVLLLLPSFSGATSLKADELIANLKTRYSGVTTLTAEFRQVVVAKGAKIGETSTGRVWFKRPGKMRWTYETPEKDEIIGDGKTIRIFQPDLNQVVERPVDAAYLSIVTDFLSGIAKLDEDFKITLAKEDAESYLLLLKPRDQQPSITDVTIEIDKKSGLVTKTVVTDMLGNTTAVSFTRIKTNEAVKDSLFAFKPPKGAIIVRP